MPETKPRVALFRARADAARSARRLSALGFSVACLPVIEARAIPFQALRPRYDAVVATSAKAFLADAPIDRAAHAFVVGLETARAAEARGLKLAAPPAPDAERLIETIKSRLPPGSHVLYLAGRDRKRALEDALAGSYALEVVETYAAEARERWRPGEVRAVASCVAALHYSRRSAALAARLADEAGVAARFRALRHVCLSRDAAEPMISLGADVIVAEAPDEPSLLAALRKAFVRISFG